MSKNKIYRKSDDFVYRKIGGETILVPIKKAIQKLQSIYTLNETACRVWELLDGRRDAEDIASCFSSEFDVSCDTAAEDVKSCLNQLASIGAVL